MTATWKELRINPVDTLRSVIARSSYTPHVSAITTAAQAPETDPEVGAELLAFAGSAAHTVHPEVRRLWLRQAKERRQEAEERRAAAERLGTATAPAD